MRAFVAVEPPHLSKGLHRVADALARYAPPGVEIVAREEDADLVLRHVIGYPETLDAVSRALGRDQRYALFQYCMRTTQEPHTASWVDLWASASVVVSYYDLRALAREDGGACDFNFLHTPLGVDGDVFRPNGHARRFKIGTSGYVAETEGVVECHQATRSLGAYQAHLGPNLGLDGVEYRHGLSDEGVAELWGQCEYVAGLRRCEGFELPAIEGLACGARPVVFDRPHYSTWLGEHADYVPECEPGELVGHLAEVLAQPARPVTDAERAAVLERFNWETLAAGFWERAL